jgi:hypothetical protein
MNNAVFQRFISAHLLLRTRIVTLQSVIEQNMGAQERFITARSYFWGIALKPYLKSEADMSIR